MRVMHRVSALEASESDFELRGEGNELTANPLQHSGKWWTSLLVGKKAQATTEVTKGLTRLYMNVFYSVYPNLPIVSQSNAKCSQKSIFSPYTRSSAANDLHLSLSKRSRDDAIFEEHGKQFTPRALFYQSLSVHLDISTDR